MTFFMSPWFILRSYFDIIHYVNIAIAPGFCSQPTLVFSSMLVFMSRQLFQHKTLLQIFCMQIAMYISQRYPEKQNQQDLCMSPCLKGVLHMIVDVKFKVCRVRTVSWRPRKSGGPSLRALYWQDFPHAYGRYIFCCCCSIQALLTGWIENNLYQSKSTNLSSFFFNIYLY